MAKVGADMSELVIKKADKAEEDNVQEEGLETSDSKVGTVEEDETKVKD